MDEVLSQAEIDNLLKAMGDGEVKPDQLDAQVRAKVKNYDFKRPNKFSKDQINTLHNIYDNYSRALSSHWSADLHAVIETHLAGIEQITYSEFIRSLPNPTIMGICELDPLGSLLINISPGLAFVMVDLLLGGQGSDDTQSRDLTEIERLIVEKKVKSMVDLLPESWEAIIQLKASLLSIESNPQFTQVVAGTEMVGLVTIEVKIGAKTELVHVCLPYIMLEPVLPKLSAQVWFTTKQPQPVEKDELLNKLDKVRLPLSVILGSATLYVHDLVNLSVGDVLTLNQKLTDPVKLIVGSKTKFLAKPGMSGTHIAVQITGRVDEGDDYDE